MADPLSRRYALFGWAVWMLAKRRLRRRLRRSGATPRRRGLLGFAGAVAVVATLGAAWSRRGDGGSGEGPS